MGFRLVNVSGRAALADGARSYELAAIGDPRLGADPMAALREPEALAEVAASLVERVPTGALADVALGPPVPSPQMVFAVPALVAYLSRITTLTPGDLLFTGTPAGVGATRGLYLADGDEIVTTIDGVGTMTHRCILET